MLNCIYHPDKEMRVVDDDEYKRLLETGEWFKHPNEAKNARVKNEQLHEKQRLQSKRRKRGSNLEQSSENGGISA